MLKRSARIISGQKTRRLKATARWRGWGLKIRDISAENELLDELLCRALPLPPLPDERAEEVLRDEGLALEDLPRQRRGVLVREPALNRRPLVDVAVERAYLCQGQPGPIMP